MSESSDAAAADLLLRGGLATTVQLADARELVEKLQALGVERDLLGALVDRKVIDRATALVIRSGLATPEQLADARELVVQLKAMGVERDLLGALVEREVIDLVTGLVIRSGKVTFEQLADARRLVGQLRGLGVERDLLGALVERQAIERAAADDIRARAATGSAVLRSPHGDAALPPGPAAPPERGPAPYAADAIPLGDAKPREVGPDDERPHDVEPGDTGKADVEVEEAEAARDEAGSTPARLADGREPGVKAVPAAEGEGGGVARRLPPKWIVIGAAAVVVVAVLAVRAAGPSAELSRARELEAEIRRLEGGGRTQEALALAEKLAATETASGEKALSRLVAWGGDRADALRLAAALAEVEALREARPDAETAELLRYRQELRKLAEKHAGLAPVKTAVQKLIDGIDARIERAGAAIEAAGGTSEVGGQLSAAESLLEEAESEAGSLMKMSRYGHALEAIEERRARLPGETREGFGAKFDRLRENVLTAVRAMFKRKDTVARAHVWSRRYAEARKVYREAIATFGVDEITREAESSIRRIGMVQRAAKRSRGRARPVAASAQPVEQRDEVTLKSGEKFSGFIVSESKAELVFDLVFSGASVSKTRTMRTTLRVDEIETIHRLSEGQRAAARDYLEKVRREEPQDALAQSDLHVLRTRLSSEEARSFGMRLAGTEPTIPVRKVELEHFVIVADLETELLQKVAFRLGKVFNAYKAHFGVDRNEPERIHVVILSSMEEYYDAIGREFVNPAFYAPERKVIWAAFGVAELKAAIDEIRKHHEELNDELKDARLGLDGARKEARKTVHDLYERLQRLKVSSRQKMVAKAIMKDIRRRQTKYEVEIARWKRSIEEIQRKIEQYDRKNDLLFAGHTEAMIRAMYHEGFHAFLDQFLFDEDLVEHVPRWLNEGLAQYFESARVEAGRLILGQEDRARLRALRRSRTKGTLVSIEKMVTADAKDYLVHEIGNVEKAANHYLMSWCVVHLLGERGRLQKRDLEAFVALTSFADRRERMMQALPLLTGMTDLELRAKLDERLQAHARGELHEEQ